MPSNRSITLNRRRLLAGAAATSSFVAIPSILRAQGAALKVGVLLPRSGAQASIGQDCQRGVDVTAGLLKQLGYPSLQIMNADTETNVEVARARAEKLISDGAQLLVGAFDSGQSTAIAQVAEQKGIPFVINIAAAPPITEQGYKFVFRNFPTAVMILSDAFQNQKEVFEASGVAPKTVVFMHVNDTFGTAMQKGIGGLMPKFNMPYTIKETISYDPTARDLSVEVSKAKATGADALLAVSRLNDAILITREMVKQRWSPMGVLSMGPGWYEDQYLKTLGKLADGPLSFVPWYDPNKKVSKLLEGSAGQGAPRRQPQHQPDLHLRSAAGGGRRLQAGRLRRSQGAGRRDPQDQHHRQRQHRPRHPVRRQGPERQAQEFRHPESRRQAGHGGAEGRDQRQGRMADEAVRQALGALFLLSFRTPRSGDPESRARCVITGFRVRASGAPRNDS